jgi:predicted DCC family thiol-disulfide oxidoreductase YuxK
MVGPNQDGSVSLLFDAGCGVCTWIANEVRLRGHGTISVSPIGSPTANELIGDLPAKEQWSSWHIVTDGRRYSGGEGFAPLLRAVGAPRWLAHAAESQPKLVGATYAYMAARRAQWGRVVPSRAVARARQALAAPCPDANSGPFTSDSSGNAPAS